MASNELELCVLRKYISHKLNKWQIFMLTINNKSTAPKAIILKSSTLSNTSRNTHTHTLSFSLTHCAKMGYQIALTRHEAAPIAVNLTPPPFPPLKSHVGLLSQPQTNFAGCVLLAYTLVLLLSVTCSTQEATFRNACIHWRLSCSSLANSVWDWPFSLSRKEMRMRFLAAGRKLRQIGDSGLKGNKFELKWLGLFCP